MTTSAPRERNAQATRALILAAARQLFAAGLYEAVGMRDVAQAAGVNVALVSRYFGSKEDLFRKVLLERQDAPWVNIEDDLLTLATRLGTLPFTDAEDDHSADLERLHIILRSASSPAMAAMIGKAFVEEVFTPLAARLAPDAGSAEGQVRAGLALTLVIGATVLNSILSVEMTGAKARDEGRRRLIAMIAAAMLGEPSEARQVVGLPEQ